MGGEGDPDQGTCSRIKQSNCLEKQAAAEMAEMCEDSTGAQGARSWGK